MTTPPNKPLLVPLPSYGFDPSEVAIPWRVLKEGGVQMCFATPTGEVAAADRRMVTGEGLGLLAPVLQARKDAQEAYAALEADSAFTNPISYGDIDPVAFAGALLPGGHDKGVREYLESEVLQGVVAGYLKGGTPVAAICHGVVLAARSQDPSTGRSALAPFKTTALLASQEMLAYNLTRLWLGDYYRTYPGITVEGEVRAALDDPTNFLRGPMPILRDDPSNLDRGFVVKDGAYLSARWPGDAYHFAAILLKMLQGDPQA